MDRLNLPAFDIHVQRRNGRPVVFDMLRRKYVALTPEEWVRQHFIHYLTDYLGYPQGLLQNEVQLTCGEKRVRCDSVLYSKTNTARMIVEYKAPSVTITQAVFNQISAYNLLLHVDYLIITNGITHYCCKMDYEHETYVFLNAIPTYEQLSAGY